MVEIFKTNITDKGQARSILKNLRPLLPDCKLNFDLDDCDNILRVESNSSFNINAIKTHFSKNGFWLDTLE